MDRMKDIMGNVSDDDTGGSQSHRGKAAAQACETCRNRKVKCDEERPRCGVCRRLDAKCDYREPKPTKKDKTLVYVLETLKSIDHKVDTLLREGYDRGQHSSSASTLSLMSRSQTSRATAHTWGTSIDEAYSSASPASTMASNIARSAYNLSSQGPNQFQSMQRTSSPQDPRINTAQGLTSQQPQGDIEPRRVLTWPVIRKLLEEEGVPEDLIMSQFGRAESWLTRISAEFSKELPQPQPVRFFNHSHSGIGNWESGTMVLTNAIIEEYMHYYFSSFHFLYPILDQDYFIEVTASQASRNKFDESDSQTTLLLLVMALGFVAKTGITGEKVTDNETGFKTGIRGGDAQNPPGFALVHEAKRRIGLSLSRHDCTTLHCYVLLSIYYAQVSRNMDYWHVTEMASTMCQNLVKTVDNWDTHEGDTIARAFWMCQLLEGGLTTELGIGSSGIVNLTANVPLPKWSPTWNGQLGGLRDYDSIIRTYFLAQITLRSQINRITDSIKAFRNPYSPTSISTPLNPPRQIIHELIRALSIWRSTLPEPLRWTDIPPSPPNSPASTASYISLLQSTWQQPYSGIRSITPNFKNMDVILDAALRSRFKYAQYLIYRPYIYKALHFPQETQEEEVMMALSGLRACTLWPLTHPVFADQRRVLPHLYEYSHAIFGVLLLFVAAKRSPLLSPYLEDTGSEMDAGVPRSPFPSATALMTGYPNPEETYPAQLPSISLSAPSSQSPSDSMTDVIRSGMSTTGLGMVTGGITTREKGKYPSTAGAGGAGDDGEAFQALGLEVAITKDSFLAWLRDMQVVHPVARWAWLMLRQVYAVNQQ